MSKWKRMEFKYTPVVLVVDDNGINRTIIKSMLRGMYYIKEAENGQEALDILLNPEERIDLMLLDVVMPHVDGMTVLKTLQEKKAREDLPIIMITSLADAESIHEAYRYGCIDYISRPFVDVILQTRVRNALLLNQREDQQFETEGNTRAIGEMVFRIEEEQRNRLRKLISNEMHSGFWKNNNDELDEITGLLNRNAFRAKAETLLKENPSQNDKYTICYFNVCNFKLYNAKYGYVEGDELLNCIASLLQTKFGKDLMCRIGDDRFTLLTERDNYLDLVEEIAGELRANNGDGNVILRAGVYHLAPGDKDIDAVRDRAKFACDIIKNRFDVSYQIYDENLQNAFERQNYIIDNIDIAIENGYLEVYYQPVVRSYSRELCGLEALARWNDPIYGFMSPGDFIEILEQFHLIYKVDTYVIKKVCQDLATSFHKHIPVVPVSVNLSRSDFECCNILEILENTVEEYDVSRHLLHVEITETQIMEKPEYMAKEIRKLRDAGYQVWMDDFGSGYSSLNVLKDFEFDLIKLDMSFLSHFDDKSKEIVESVISMGKRLGIQTLAEGVETEEQLRFLQDIGCEKVQGFLFDKPVPMAETVLKTTQGTYVVEDCTNEFYLDQIGRANYVNVEGLSHNYLSNDMAVAVIEYHDKKMQFKQVTKAFREFLPTVGVETIELAEILINDPYRRNHGFFVALAERCIESGKEEVLDFVELGDYCNARARLLAINGQTNSYAIRIIVENLSKYSDFSQNYELDESLRYLYTMYNRIDLIDLDHWNGRNIYLNDMYMDKHQLLEEMENSSVKDVAKDLVIGEEVYDFICFYDVETMAKRLDENKERCMSAYFHMKRPNGLPQLQLHIIMPMEFGTRRMALACSRYLMENEIENFKNL